MNMFRPEASIKLKSKLEAIPEYTSWDIVDVTGDSSQQFLGKLLDSCWVLVSVPAKIGLECCWVL